MKYLCRLAAMGLTLLLLCTALTPVVSAEQTKQTQDDPPRVLRVAFPESPLLSETDEKGLRHGQTEDFLEEIAKYTGWKYEYVTGEPDELIKQLKNGEIDLMGGMLYSEEYEDMFAYPDYIMGYSYAALYARNEDETLYSFDSRSMKGKTIGVFAPAQTKIDQLKKQLDFNNISCELRYYTNEDLVGGDLHCYLKNGEVDLLLGNDLENDGSMRTVYKFRSQPYYMVTYRGNDEIFEQLNQALFYILNSDPDFAEKCYQKNFTQLGRPVQLKFTKEEKDYIAQADTLRVAVMSQWHPLYCLEDGASHNGIVLEFLDEVAKKSGLTFEYVFADSYDEMIRMVQNGEADIVGSFLDSTAAAGEKNLVKTSAYVVVDDILMKNIAVEYPAKGLSVGVLRGRSLPLDVEAASVREYPTVREGLAEVNSGKIDMFYGFAASVEDDIQTHRLPNISVVTLPESDTNISFAISRSARHELFTILNKIINNISQEEKAALSNRNMVSLSYKSMWDILLYSDPLLVVAAIVVFFVLLLTVILLIARSRLKNAEMKNELQRAEAASQTKSAFLSRMSHEIRTPMNAIVGLADLAGMAENVSPEIEGYLNKMQSASHYLLSLINDILDMSSIENDKMILAAEGFSLSRMVNELESMMQAQAQRKDLRFGTRCETEKDGYVGDVLRLKQVLTNLLSNAVKFTPMGGEVSLCIDEQSHTQQTAVLRFSVKDTGVGIAPEAQKKVFAAFEQVGSSISKSEGTGLGLPISSAIVEQMGGRLELNSVPEKGSEFFFTLTLPFYDEVPSPLLPTETVQNADLNGVCILLAEDNDLNAEIAIELLQMQGARVERAVNGQEAVERFKSSKQGYYKLILMDIQMPVKNGLEATVELRQSGHPDAKKIPIVAMTANSFKEDMDTAREAGMDAFVPKPVDIKYLYGVLERLLAERKTAQEKQKDR